MVAFAHGVKNFLSLVLQSIAFIIQLFFLSFHISFSETHIHGSTSEIKLLTHHFNFSIREFSYLRLKLALEHFYYCSG